MYIFTCSSAIRKPGTSGNTYPAKDTKMCSQNPCFIDETGTVHECCGITHAMEHQRRTIIVQRKNNMLTIIICVCSTISQTHRRGNGEGCDTLPITRMQPTGLAIQKLLWEITCKHWCSKTTGTYVSIVHNVVI